MSSPHRDEFPPGFSWGCATSAYQIEGAVAEGGRGESIWDRFCAQPGTIRDGSSGAIACDHYHRWPEDLDIARQLGLNAYRFSIAWPRIFADGQGDKPLAAGLDYYDRLVDGLLERGLAPWATLYHWDLPQALQDQGGWLQRGTVEAFADYAAVMGQRLGDRVKRWMTHNEPWCTAMLGHAEGVHAPGIKDLGAALQVCHHVLLSHGAAVQALRAAAPGAQVGIALSLHPVRAASPTAADEAAARRHDGLRNRWFLDPLYGRGYPADVLARLGALVPTMQAGDLALIATPCDFLGVNYYFPETVADAPGQGPMATQVVHTKGLAHTAFGWPIDAPGLTELLLRVQRDYQPREIALTENGACFDDTPDADGLIHDPQRQAFLSAHFEAARDALRAGVALSGYFVWSLLDNFEWAEGYTRRFGLVHVDYATQQRRLKSSGHWLRGFLTEQRTSS